MVIQTAIILSTILLFSSSVFAREGIPTNHSHDGRAHTHPLPAEGLSHNHKYKAPEHKAPTWIVVHESRTGTGTGTGTPYFWLAQKGSLVVMNGKRTVLIKRIGGPKPGVIIINKVSVTHSDCGKKRGYSQKLQS